ncbi:hypothetical protein E4K73_44500 [Streptomyces sp. IB201691-2A2]|nr:hypothetical protein E4K73_44500 [Streptomyces sp. IB201691-2A2]
MASVSVRSGLRRVSSLRRSRRVGLAQDADRAAYADVVSECAALGRDELREVARAVTAVTSGRC